MYIKTSISYKVVRKTLFLLIVLLLSVHLLGTHAQAFACSSVALCGHCVMESHRHSTATNPYAPLGNCPLGTQNVPCDLEGTGNFARSQFILSSGVLFPPDFSGFIAGLPDEVAGKYISKRTMPSRHSESADHNIPLYLQNLSLRC